MSDNMDIRTKSESDNSDNSDSEFQTKSELLFEIEQMDRKGLSYQSNLNMSSTLNEIRYEHSIMNHQMEYSIDINWVKNIISGIILSYDYFISETPISASISASISTSTKTKPKVKKE